MNAEIITRVRPILFSSDMVRAILVGRKTQTRRIGKCQNSDATELGVEYSRHATRGDVPVATYRAFPGTGGSARWGLCECPFGSPGDRLWVRETFFQWGHWEKVSGVKTKMGRQKWKFVAVTNEVRYIENPPDQFRKGRHNADPETNAWHKRLGRFMPRALSRTNLEIVGIRVERLNDISEKDAIAEGCEMDGIFPKEQPHKSGIGDVGWDDAVEWYSDLWEEINGLDSWDKNPWVWVVEFKKLP